MRRLFWLAMGVTIGAMVMRRVSKLAEKLTPRGISGAIASSVAELIDSLRYFASDVRKAMDERELEIRESAGLDATVGKVR